MSKKIKSVQIAASLAAILFIFSLAPVFGWSPWKNNDSSEESGQTKGFIGVTKSSGGNVIVDLTPVTFEDDKLIVKISINTHTVNDLNKYNLAEITQLETGSTSIKPTRSPRLGGHHNNGTYEFDLHQLPETGFKITISGLDTPGTREFVWP